MRNLIDIKPLLEPESKIVIVHHYNADADALGSSLGLKLYFESKQYQVDLITPNELPAYLMWMPSAKSVKVYEHNETQCDKILQEANFLFCLDFNHFSRTKIMTEALGKSPAKKVLIDHHLFPDTASFDFGESNSDKSSTCEMVFDLIQAFEDDTLLNKEIATCLYAGAMTDTGSFKFSSTTASVHFMVAKLIDKGIEIASIHQKIFDNFDENRLRFLGFILSEKMILMPEYHAAIIPVSKEDIHRFDIKSGETEGIVNYPLSLKHIIFSTFISEREGENRMSFRSKGNFNVNEFARSYFDGGGHMNASGGKSITSLSETIQQLTNHIISNQEKLKTCFQELQQA